MNTLVETRALQPLRRAFLLDAIATGTLGLALALAAGPLQPWLGLPVALLREAGFVCIAFAAWLGFALMRPALTRAMAGFAVGVNLLWVVASLGLVASGWVRPTALGVAFVVAQALVVAVFAGLQYLGARRATRM